MKGQTTKGQQLIVESQPDDEPVFFMEQLPVIVKQQHIIEDVLLQVTTHKLKLRGHTYRSHTARLWLQRECDWGCLDGGLI